VWWGAHRGFVFFFFFFFEIPRIIPRLPKNAHRIELAQHGLVGMVRRVTLIALAAPVAEALVSHALFPAARCAPFLGRTALSPVALAYEPPYQPIVADYGAQLPPPPRQKSGGGLTVAMGGLIVTLLASASALSMTGAIATIAASAAGLFSFKVAKELNQRGVDRGRISKVTPRPVRALRARPQRGRFPWHAPHHTPLPRCDLNAIPLGG